MSVSVPLYGCVVCGHVYWRSGACSLCASGLLKISESEPVQEPEPTLPPHPPPFTWYGRDPIIGSTVEDDVEMERLAQLPEIRGVWGVYTQVIPMRVRLQIIRATAKEITNKRS